MPGPHFALRIKSVGPTAFIGLLMAGFGAMAPVYAAGTADEQQACTPDVFRLCSAEIPSESRIVACLNREKARLSPACLEVIDGEPARRRRAASRRASH